MAKIEELITMLHELDDQLSTCMRCGMCQAVCPVFKQSGMEADVTRGKLALLDGLAQEMITDPKGVNEKLSRCLMCGTCEKNCPSGVKVLDIFLKGRAILTGYLGLPTAKKLIFQQMLTRPGLMNKLLEYGGKFQGVFSKKADAMLGTSCARFNAPLIADRHFPSVPPKAFHKDISELNTPAGTSNLKVAFFPGCVSDKFFPSVCHAVMKALDHHGVGVYLPKGQACCGIPALSSGDRDSFEKMVKMNVALFENADYDALITPCATCTATIKELWPSMVRDPQLKTRLIPIAEKTMDVSEFLVKKVGVTALEGNGGEKVTYHDPCHLRNSLGVTAEPRTMLKASKGAELTEMADAMSCCGCGGSFTVQHYDLSRTIGQAKAKNAMNTGARNVATSCPACMMQLKDQLSQQGAGMGVKHVIEVYAESLG